MDPERFDRIAMRMGGGSSRRGMLGGASRRSLLQFLSALPLGGGLASLVVPADARKGKGNGRGGNGKNDDDNEGAANENRARRRNKRCKKRKAKACDGRCGTVTVTCKKRNGKTRRTQVNCGSCACDPRCGECFTCDEATTTCVVDPEQQGDPCGSTGQVCQAGGTCACDAESCPAGRVCVDGSCVPDPGTCSAGENICRDGLAPCGDHPRCQCVTTTSSVTFCGIGSATCSDCSSDEDCATVTGPGSVCADYTGDFCSCRDTSRRACVAPCGQCTNNAQCGGGMCCDGTCSFECCTSADCGDHETCEGGICVCQGCRSHINNRCEVGDAWGQCGADGDRCTECAGGQVCAAGSQTCASCEQGSVTRGTFCEVRDDFARFQCAPNCACAASVQGGDSFGTCFSGAGYCLRGPEQICEFDSDCVIDGYGTSCIRVGDCEPGCVTACVTQCASDERSSDGPPRLVVLN